MEEKDLNIKINCQLNPIVIPTPAVHLMPFQFIIFFVCTCISMSVSTSGSNQMKIIFPNKRKDNCVCGNKRKSTVHFTFIAVFSFSAKIMRYKIHFAMPFDWMEPQKCANRSDKQEKTNKYFKGHKIILWMQNSLWSKRSENKNLISLKNYLDFSFYGWNEFSDGEKIKLNKQRVRKKK